MADLKKILKLSPAPETELTYNQSVEYYTRYSNNAISENIKSEDKMLEIRVIKGKKMGIASTNLLDKKNILKTYDKAMQALKAGKKDKSIIPLTKKKKYNENNHYNEKTANYSPIDKANRLKEILSTTGDYKVSGLFTNGYSYYALANSNGVNCDYKSSSASVSFTVQGQAGSSSWQGEAANIDELDVKEIFNTAKKYAGLNKDAKDIKPGKYDVVLSPYAFEELIFFLLYYGLATLPYIEKRSAMNGKLGKKIASEKLTLYDNAFEPGAGGMPFDFEGTPRKKVMLINKGVLENFVHDRRTAKKMKTKNTGHSIGEPNTYGPIPMCPVFEGGKASPEEMIKSMKKGLYIRKLHYTNVLNPKELLVTGMTRDGVFMVENGEIKHAVKNLRFSDSLFNILSGIDMLGPVTAIDFDEGWGKIPWVKINGFNFTSKTEF